MSDLSSAAALFMKDPDGIRLEITSYSPGSDPVDWWVLSNYASERTDGTGLDVSCDDIGHRPLNAALAVFSAGR